MVFVSLADAALYSSRVKRKYGHLVGNPAVRLSKEYRPRDRVEHETPLIVRRRLVNYRGNSNRTSFGLTIRVTVSRARTATLLAGRIAPGHQDCAVPRDCH
jgi:hypothetical protein